MAVTVTENLARVLSTGQNPTAELYYTVHGTSDEVEARTQLALNSPATYDPYGTGLVFIPRETITVEALSDTIWNGIVRYGFTAPETDESTESFDTTGGQQHVTQSLETAAVYKRDEDANEAPDYGGAIGVTPDGNVEGVDIVVPVYHHVETHYFDEAQITNAYKRIIYSLTGKVNNAPFKGFEAGECLFLGASGSRRRDKWEVTFNFAASPNAEGTTENPAFVLDGIKIVRKDGWNYLWAPYVDVEDAAAKALGKKPLAFYIERVYHQGDFSALGIGV